MKTPFGHGTMVRTGASFAIFLVVMILLGARAPGAQEAGTVGTVQAVAGSVHAIAPRSGASRALSAGGPLFEGDLVRTGPDGRASLRLTDGSVLQLGHNTDLELAWVLADSASGIREVALEISRGIARAVVGTLFPRSAVQIGTTTAVTSVRGTDWITEAQAGTSAVVVLDGRVEVRSLALPAANVTLAEGEGTDVAAGEPPTPPARWGDARREAFIARTAPPPP